MARIGHLDILVENLHLTLLLSGTFLIEDTEHVGVAVGVEVTADTAASPHATVEGTLHQYHLV